MKKGNEMVGIEKRVWELVKGIMIGCRRWLLVKTERTGNELVPVFRGFD